jgi:predicted dehydrogenase
MNRKLRVPRRRFLATTGAVLAAPYFVPATALALRGRPGANDRLTVAHIGVGGMGGGHLQRMTEFRAEGRVNIAAVCDVDEGRLAQAVNTAGEGVTPYRDYRHICLREDIDAVVIATPDHWHAVQTVHACETGKHVYVEKPASVTVEEGRAMVTAARARGRKVQVGAQGRTGWGAYHTCRAIRNGMVGKVSRVTCWHYENPVGGDQPDAPPPPELDWDLWLGPMRWRSYNPAYCPGTFRWFLESGGGQIRDRGAHQFSTILWCMNADGPRSFTVEATGTPPPHGLWDCPVDMQVTFQFQDPAWTLVWAQPGDKLGKLEFGNVFWGENGQRLILEWEGAYKPAEPEAMNFQVPPGGFEPYRTNEYPDPGDFNKNHMADWFKAIREPDYLPAVDIEIAHRTATLCIVANLSYILRRKLVWDADKEQVVGDEQANRLLAQPQRHPYHL